MKLDDLKKKNPCPTCCQNLKVFQSKVKSLEARAMHAESSRDTFQLKAAELFEKLQQQVEENHQLKAQVRELSWKPGKLGTLVQQVQLPVPQ